MSATIAGAGRLLPATPVAEGWEAHLSTFGVLPAAGPRLIEELERSGLRGRGGAGFPTAQKWRAVREHSGSEEPPLVVANGVETEPASLKDRTLLALRPHLVLDGLELAARTLGATRAILAVSRSQSHLARSLADAIGERRRAGGTAVELAAVPARYVAGEETALVAALNARAAKPHTVPPRPYASGVGGRPTLVQNAETLAHVALIARYGAGWFRAAGTAETAGTVLVTVCGAVRSPGVREVSPSATIAALVAEAGGVTAEPSAVLLGGYFGRWAAAATAWPLTLEPSSLAAEGLALGAGLVAVLPRDVCGVAESDRILAFLARESAGQCGPCHLGLPALSRLFHAAAGGRGRHDTLSTLARWALEIRGRGACRHPDGATLFAASAMEVFGSELRRHLRSGPCPAASLPPLLPTPQLENGWR